MALSSLLREGDGESLSAAKMSFRDALAPLVAIRHGELEFRPSVGNSTI